MTVTGSGSVLNVSNGLEIGGPGCGCGSPSVGTLTVADGAVVNSPASTAIFAGSTLNLGTGGLSGAIVTPAIANDGQIVANFTDTLSLAANISGAGTLSKLGSGTLILTGTNTYTGGTTVNGGPVNFATAANSHRDDHAERRRPAMGDRQHHRHLRAARAAGRGRRLFDTNGKRRLQLCAVASAA